MRVAFLKPDHGGVGGFERLVARCRTRLAERGVDVTVVPFDAATRATAIRGVPLAGVRDAHDDLFLLLAAVERMDRLHLDPFDVVVASQPPTYLARHPAVVALTYHQARVFYDLSEDYVAAGFALPAVHAAACEQVHALDAARIGGVRTWLTGSDEVAGRLARTWGVTGTTPFRARPELDPVPDADGYDPHGPVVCVSRHEWPKRTELVAQAALLAPAPSGAGQAPPDWELVGGGSRLPWLAHLVDRWIGDPERADADGPADTWRTRGTALLADEERHLPTDAPVATPAGGTLRILGEVDDATRDDAYRRAGVVVAPARAEDYGLTVLEAFARARPVIVCDDGGGLVELVEGTGAALVVEPTAAALRQAVDALRSDPPRARAMAEAALAVARDRHAVDDLAPLLAAIEGAAR